MTTLQKKESSQYEFPPACWTEVLTQVTSSAFHFNVVLFGNFWNTNLNSSLNNADIPSTKSKIGKVRRNKQHNSGIQIFHYQKSTSPTNCLSSFSMCIWDDLLLLCRDLNCIDLYGSTDEACNAQLSYCTTYGERCGKKDTCQNYDNAGICPSVGSDGICILDVQCRLKKCSDINNDSQSTVSCQSQLSNCVSDGTKCMEKSKCTSYLTETSCISGGTDGICLYQSNRCILMRSCSDANLNSNACNAAKNRCVLSNNFLCIASSCQNQFESLKICTYYYDWSNQITFCILENNFCREILPKYLGQEECLTHSQYTYSWNDDKQLCLSCSSPQQFPILSISESVNCTFSNSCLTPSIQIYLNTEATQLGLAILINFLIN